MTPQELKLLDELFDRLASLESAPRDPDAVRAINEGLKLAPNALYPLVQTALVQDEALKQADARIRELEAELGIGQPQQPQQGGFLDSMRDALTGRREQQDQRGSVPSVRPGTPQSPWRNTTGMQGGGYPQEPGYAAAPAPQQAPGAGGGSFLGTAAATAAGVVGGALLMNSFRGMFGGGRPERRSGTEPQRVRLLGRQQRQPLGRQRQRRRNRPRCRSQRYRRQRPHGVQRRRIGSRGIARHGAERDRRSVRFRRRRHR